MRTQKSILVIVAFLTIGFGLNAQTNSCGGFGGFFVDTWEDFYTIAHPIGKEALKLIPIVGQIDEATQAISDVSEEFHNEVFNENRQSWATIGAREIPVLKGYTTQGGTLQRVGPVAGVRVFTTAPLWWDRVEIEIEKTDGRLRTEVVICTFDVESGAKNNVENYMFPNGNDLSSKKFVLRGVHGKSISVKLLGKEMSLDRFRYRIKTKGYLNMNKQRERAGGNIKIGAVGQTKKGHRN